MSVLEQTVAAVLNLAVTAVLEINVAVLELTLEALVEITVA